MKTVISSLLFAVLIAGVCAGETPSRIIDLQKELEKNGRQALAGFSVKVANAVKETDLSPSADVRTNAMGIAEMSSQLLADLREGKFGKDSSEAKAVSTTIRAALGKLDSVIEEDYKEHPGRANVFPPAGTPNASAGMSPDAISDPELKRRYLEAIANEKQQQLKNSQQREARMARRVIMRGVSSLETFTKEELIDRFTDEGKSREILREGLASELKR